MKDERSQVWQRYANYLLEAIHAHREGVRGYTMWPQGIPRVYFSQLKVPLNKIWGTWAVLYSPLFPGWPELRRQNFESTKCWIDFPLIDLDLNRLSTFWTTIAIFNVLELHNKKRLNFIFLTYLYHISVFFHPLACLLVHLRPICPKNN